MNVKNTWLTYEEKKERVDKVLALVRDGLRTGDAAKEIGVTAQQYYDWRKKVYPARTKTRLKSKATTVLTEQTETSKPTRAPITITTDMPRATTGVLAILLVRETNLRQTLSALYGE